MSARPVMIGAGAAIVPPRSHFYRMAPMGVGTPQVEALGGYLARLAAAHRLALDSLVCRGLVWIARGEPQFVGRHLEWKNFGSGKFLDSDPGGVMAGAASVATTIAGLELLTMEPLRELVADRGLKADTRSWCPECYQESRHERLAWRLAPVTACARHGTLLTRACPKCGRLGAPYAGTVRVARCGFCAADLACDHQGPEADAAALEVARSVADLLERMPALAGASPQNLLTRRFVAACQSAELTMVGASRRFQIPRATASCWWAGKATPSLSKAVALAGLFGQRLGAFLAGACGDGVGGEVPRERRRRRRIDWGSVARVVRGHAQPRESVLALARRLDVDPAALRRKFPRECAGISARADERAAQVRAQWLAAEGSRLCAALDELKAAGVAPTIRRLGEAVGHSGSLRDPALRARVAAHIQKLKKHEL